MTKPNQLAKNAAVSLAGQIVPMAAALVSIPLLIHGLGTDRYSLLLLVWLLVGYFGFVDLGLGRALTHAVASRLGGENEHELSELVWTGLVLMLGLGLVGGVALAASAGFISRHLKDIPPELETETLRSIYWLALSLPVVVCTAGLRGIIEAHQHFVASTVLRLPLAFFSYIAPLAVLPFTHRLDVVVAVLVIGRMLAGVAHLIVCLRRYWFLKRKLSVHRRAVAPLLRVGGWMTVSNIVSPLMTSVDRFFIGGLLAVTQVAYYATPYEAVTKLLVFPTAVVAVLFPAFSNIAANDRGRLSQLLHDGIRTIVVCLFPVTFVLAAMPGEVLSLWLHSSDVAKDVAQHGAPVLRWLAIGVFFNSIGYVPFVALQGAGRPDITGKLNLIELPVYAGALWFFANHWGIVGVAIAWTLRVACDAALMYVATRRVADSRQAQGLSPAILITMAAAFAACFVVDSTFARLGLALGVIVAYLPIAWIFLIQPAEKAAILAIIRRPVRPSALSPETL